MSPRLTRIALSLPVIIAMVVLAFGLGTYFGGKYLVPPGQGLAAPAEALGYGLLASLAGLAVSIVAATRMPMKALIACVVAGMLGLTILAIAIAIAVNNADHDSQPGSDAPPPRTTTTTPVTEPAPTLPDEEPTR
ncbi:hypothetical protein AWH62_00650 [Maricaulis sp. W15]|uniref:hypothetical protein n=1 Tax=Maricaulis sp. W15 TaxID=1772333 RepID=UPI0009491157|nr:hypothetical protein [Maricaulis sp. W15]OLF81220.1 hypothetical protein AWH62_00650 [Maricaulis sp. W15]